MISRRLGDQNGWTVPVFRVLLIVVPIAIAAVLSLNCWLVQSIYMLSQEVALVNRDLTNIAAAGPRYTESDARADQVELREALLGKIAEGPRWLRDALVTHGNRLEQLESRSHSHAAQADVDAD